MIIIKQPTGSAKFVVRKNGGRLHWLQIIVPTVGQDAYVHLYDKQSRSGVITDAGGGDVLLTVDSGLGMGHQLGDAGDVVAGVEVLSANHSGAKTVTIVDKFSFTFTDTYVADDVIVFWSGAITPGTTVASLIIKAPGADADAYAGDFAGVIDATFEQGVIGVITTTLTGGAGVPTAPVHVTAVFEEK